jgi:crotonobetainyl-CoA:carnitine CoA-transferase CaiB-like acyl-CoA transferase
MSSTYCSSVTSDDTARSQGIFRPKCIGEINGKVEHTRRVRQAYLLKARRNRRTACSDRRLDEFHHPTEGRIRTPAIATRFSRTVPEIRRLQPRLGEDSVEVLGEAGFSRLEIDELIAIGATRDGWTV